ncbi:MAG: 4Fe-4S binding protein [Lachnospiraceae bacterium]|jgi:Fe-S-cluster-containing hydrogenase component 2
MIGLTNMERCSGCSACMQICPKAVHIITESLEECIDKLCGSKYIQSEIKEYF